MINKVISETIIEVTDKSLLESEKSNLEVELLYLTDNEVDYINAKKLKLQNWINILPDRKAQQGNQTMKQYLSTLKSDIESDPDTFIENIKIKLNTSITLLSKEVSELQQK